jgi:hypothetical protein
MATNVFVDGKQVPENTFLVYRPGHPPIEVSGVQGIGCDIRGDGSLVITLNSMPLVIFAAETWESVNVDLHEEHRQDKAKT